MSENLNRKDLKTLKNALGKHGITLEDFENSQETYADLPESGIERIDSFKLTEATSAVLDENDGWYVGYGVEYNGVGISSSKEGPETSESEEEEVQARNVESGESSGFDSDPPTDEEIVEKQICSEDGSDDGQILYGESSESTFFVGKNHRPVDVKLHSNGTVTEFKSMEIKGTKRCKSGKKIDKNSSSTPNGYQMISNNHEISSNLDDSDTEAFSNTESSTPCSSGLWTNFIINLKNANKDCDPISIPEEVANKIPLDAEKISEISAAMANFTLPTPPGWENIDDHKLLDFIKKRIN